MAGIAGLEPTNAGVKVQCLTDLAISLNALIFYHNRSIKSSAFVIFF